MKNPPRPGRLMGLRRIPPVLLTSLLLLFLCSPLLLFAGGPLDFLEKTARGMLEKILGGAFFDASFDILTVNPWESEASGGWQAAMVLFYSVIRPAALSLCTLCFTIRLAEAACDITRLTPERLLTPLLQFCACLVLIANLYTILSSTVSAGVETAVQVRQVCASLFAAPLLPGSTAAGESLLPQMKEIWSAAWLVVRLALPYAACWIVSLLIRVLCYGVVIEVILRSALFPLFVGDVMLHGLSGRGFQIAKGFAAACLQGAVFILISAVTGGLCRGALSAAVSGEGSQAVLEGIFQVLLFQFASLSLMMKAQDLVREAFGLR